MNDTQASHKPSSPKMGKGFRNLAAETSDTKFELNTRNNSHSKKNAVKLPELQL